MSEYKHILAASDLNHECLPVIMKAATLVKMFDAKLSVINVMPNIPYYMAAGLSSVADVEREMEAEAKDKVESALSEVGIKADIYVSGGVAKTEIIKYAKKLNVDLIVVGSHGSHGITGILGETATGVLHKAKTDVFVVRVKK